MNLCLRRSALALAITTLAGSAFAQPSAQQDTQRDIYQQERIEQGLQSGELRTKEASRLEHQEQRIDGIEARDMKDGRIGPKEQARLNAAQNRVSKHIFIAKHNG